MYSQVSLSSANTAPSEIWTHWNIAQTKEEGRAAIARYGIVQSELSDWLETPAVRQGEIDLVLRPFANMRR